MDHAVKATRGRLWHQLRFENDELECLYQRYTLKLQKFSLTGVIAIFVILSGVMATLSLIYHQVPNIHVSKKFFRVLLFYNVVGVVKYFIYYYIIFLTEHLQCCYVFDIFHYIDFSPVACLKRLSPAIFNIRNSVAHDNILFYCSSIN